MSVTIRVKNTGKSCDWGYVGFERFRQKVADLYDEELGRHYAALLSQFYPLPTKEKDFFEAYDKETERLLNDKKLKEL